MSQDPTETTEKTKPGFFRRLFGGRGPAEETPAPTTPAPTTAAPTESEVAREPLEDLLTPPTTITETLSLDLSPEPEVSEPEPAKPELPAPNAPEAAPAAPAPIVLDSSDIVTASEEVAPSEDLAPPAAPVPIETPAIAPEEPVATKSWWRRLREGLARSSSSIGSGITDIFTKRKLDAQMLEELEDVLIRADLGVTTASRISEAVGKGRYDKTIAPDEVKSILASEVERVLSPYARPLELSGARPFVILVVGVNGSGKTTTIGKLAAKFVGEGHKVILAAGDTFRAAAIAQLKIWGERFGVPVVAREQGADAAGLAYDAVEAARAQGADVLLMDTAGRLQNKAELMAELEKIIRVMRKVEPTAPHATLLVLDATVGQNAMSQVEIFGKVAGVTGLVMTKLDGTARGGILVAIAEKYKLPIHFVGVGETAEDLEPFAAKDFAAAIAGIEQRS